jgi:rhodanese-related sulfurtransferase
MKKLLIFIILAFSGSLFANVLISAEELAKMMEDENVRVVSVQTTKKYKKMHIDNSLHINLDDLQTKKTRQRDVENSGRNGQDSRRKWCFQHQYHRCI